MKEPNEIEPVENEDEAERQIDPNVQEVAEQLPAFREYQREIQSERGLTFGDW